MWIAWVLTAFPTVEEKDKCLKRIEEKKKKKKERRETLA